MMLARFLRPSVSAIRASASTTNSVLLKSLSARSSSPSFSTLAKNLAGKERVEEERFMRAQEEEWKAKVREIRAQKAHNEEEKIHNEVVVPIKKEIAEVLAETGDNVSDAGLERLAQWKLGL